MFELCNGPYSMIEKIQIQLSDTLLAVKYNEIEGKNMLSNSDEVVQINVQMITKDETQTLPWLVTDVEIPKLHGTLTDNVQSLLNVLTNGLV